MPGGAPSHDLTGRVLKDRYRVESKLGEGGMGTVYLASDQVLLERSVVVKVPLEKLLKEPGFSDRFTREIRQLVTLEHPHIVSVLDEGKLEHLPFAVLQFLGGGSLAERFEQKGAPLTPGEVMEWLPEVAETLDFIHEQDVVHRDIKPANVLFDTHGNVYVADFGIAKAFGDSGATDLTKAGEIIGSPRQMAPEALAGEAQPASDQYSLATVVFEALSGELPYEKAELSEWLTRRLTEPPRSLHSLAPHLPDPITEPVMRALSRSSEERFACCAEFAEAFGKTVAAADDDTVEINSETAQQLERRCLDAAIAETVVVGSPTELVVQVRSEASLGLRELLQGSVSFDARARDVASKDLLIEYECDSIGRLRPLDLRIEIETTDFNLPARRRAIKVRPALDSEPFVFLLTPLRSGGLRLLVNAYHAETLLASGFLKVKGDLAPSSPMASVVSFSLGVLGLPRGHRTRVGGLGTAQLAATAIETQTRGSVKTRGPVRTRGPARSETDTAPKPIVHQIPSSAADAWKENVILDDTVLSALLNLGANPSDLHDSPLHLAVAKGNFEAVDLLLGHGANPDVLDSKGCSPLYAATLKGDLDLVRVLIAGGADVNVRNADGQTPLHAVARGKRSDIAEELLRSHASWSAKDEGGRTPLQVALQMDCREVEEVLRRDGAH